MKPYQKMRILSLINPELDPAGYGYHSIQAKIAVGSGGLFGKGYLNGTQHKLHFIPEHHTDFIFTVFGEEWGFVGSVVLFLLFVSFIYRCLKISQNTSDPLGSTITFGIASIIFIQFTVNILMAINLAPVVGIPLPFISYGGSSLISTLIGVGFLAQREYAEIHVLTDPDFSQSRRRFTASSCRTNRHQLPPRFPVNRLVCR